MPLYEYKCNNCGETLEVIQKVTDPPLEQCSRCGGHLQKVITCPAIQFKGSGWYVTDYAQKGRSKSEPKPITNPSPLIDTPAEGKKSAKKENSKSAG